MQRSRPSQAHSRSRDDKGRDLSGHRKKSPMERGTLTSWRQQRDRLVRTWKETDKVRRTDCLETVEVRDCQDTEKSDRARHTHKLGTVEGRNCQDTERNQPSEAYSQTGDNSGRDSSRHRPSEVHLRSGDGRGRDLSGHRKQQTEQGVLTPWRRQRWRLVRTRKETDRAKPTHKLETAEGVTCQDTERTDRAWRTHSLETAEGRTCQDTERTRTSEVHSLSGDGRGRGMSGMERNRPSEKCSHPGDSRGRDDLLGHRKKLNEQDALTNWRQQREEGLVRTLKDTDRVKHTHFLEAGEGGACQNTERKRPSETRSLPGDGRGGDLSGHRKEPTERGAPTSWRR